MLKEYRPITNRGELSEEPREFGGFYPISYYDLSGFRKGEHIVCSDELFNGEISYDDIKQIFLVMKGAGNPFDKQTFEVPTSYPNNLLDFIQQYVKEIHKNAQNSLDIGSFLESNFNDLKNITIHIQVQNQNISLSCDKLINLIHQNLIKNEEDLLSLALKPNNQEKQEQKSQIRRHK